MIVRLPEIYDHSQPFLFKQGAAYGIHGVLNRRRHGGWRRDAGEWRGSEREGDSRAFWFAAALQWSCQGARYGSPCGHPCRRLPHSPSRVQVGQPARAILPQMSAGARYSPPAFGHRHSQSGFGRETPGLTGGSQVGISRTQKRRKGGDRQNSCRSNSPRWPRLRLTKRRGVKNACWS